MRKEDRKYREWLRVKVEFSNKKTYVLVFEVKPTSLGLSAKAQASATPPASQVSNANLELV